MDLGVYARARGLSADNRRGRRPAHCEEDPGASARATDPAWRRERRHTQRTLATPGRARVLAESSRGGALPLEKVGRGAFATDLITSRSGLEPAWQLQFALLGNCWQERYGRYFRERLT